jgi:hypothetical protein
MVISGRSRPVNSKNDSVRRDPSGFEYVQQADDKELFQQKCTSLCTNLQLYLRQHTYADIQREAQTEGQPLTGFSQSMCSLMNKGKSCVKNYDTVEWLTRFLNK